MWVSSNWNLNIKEGCFPRAKSIALSCLQPLHLRLLPKGKPGVTSSNDDTITACLMFKYHCPFQAISQRKTRCCLLCWWYHNCNHVARETHWSFMPQRFLSSSIMNTRVKKKQGVFFDWRKGKGRWILGKDEDKEWQKRRRALKAESSSENAPKPLKAESD